MKYRSGRGAQKICHNFSCWLFMLVFNLIYCIFSCLFTNRTFFIFVYLDIFLNIYTVRLGKLAKLLQVISFVLLRKHFKVREHLKSSQVLCDILIFLLFFSLFFFGLISFRKCCTCGLGQSTAIHKSTLSSWRNWCKYRGNFQYQLKSDFS